MIRPEMIGLPIPSQGRSFRPLVIRADYSSKLSSTLRSPVLDEDGSSSRREQFPAGGPLGSDANASEGIRVLLAARVRLYREGLRDALQRHRTFALLGECATVDELLREAARNPPEVVILDTSLTGDRPVVRELLAIAPGARVLALAVDDRQSVLDCAAAGMAGWVGADATVEELARAVEHVARGELICSARHAALLFGKVGDLLKQGPSDPAAPPPLTAREREVGVLLARGMSNKGISRALGIGLATVKNHVHNILGKLEVRSRAEAGGRLVQTLGVAELAPRARSRSGS